MTDLTWSWGSVSAPLSAELWGRHLRYAALAVLCLARGPMTVAELLEWLEGWGFSVVGRRPAKTLADALGHEVARAGCRMERGTYGVGQIAYVPATGS